MIRRPPRSTLSLHDALPIFAGGLRPTLFLAQLSNLLAGNISIVHGVAGSSRTFMGEESAAARSEEHTSELQSRQYLVCRLLLEKKTTNESSPLYVYLHLDLI